MLLLHDVVEVFDLSDDNLKEQPAHQKKECQLQVNSINAGFIGTTFIHGGRPFEPIALLKNALAAGSALFSDNMMSTVLPSLSTAR